MERPDTIRWGIIGAGEVAELKGGPPLYSTPGSELVAAMRRDRDKAEAFARKHGARRAYATVEELLADPEVNAVYVASPHSRHVEHASAAARAGKIVLCEKPMGVSGDEAQTIVDVCRSAGVPLCVAYYRRFWPATQAILGMLREGVIGDPLLARVQLSDYSTTDPNRLWLTSMAESGGAALTNAGSHWIDLLRFLLGEIVEVYGRVSHRAGGFEVEDTTALQLVTQGGTLVTMAVTIQCPVPTNELEILGTKGRILANPLSDGRLTLWRGRGEPEQLHFPREGATHAGLLAALVPALKSSGPSPVPGEDAVAVWRVIEAGFAASREGRRLEFVASSP